MSTMTSVKWIAGLMLVAGLSARAEGPGGEGPGGPARMRDPSEIVKRMMDKFDADKDGMLDKSELTKAIDARPHRSPSAGSGQGGDKKPGPQGGSRGSEHPQPPATEIIVTNWLETGDADKDGKLNAEELAKVLTSRPNRGGPQGGPGGGQ